MHERFYKSGCYGTLDSKNEKIDIDTAKNYNESFNNRKNRSYGINGINNKNNIFNYNEIEKRNWIIWSLHKNNTNDQINIYEDKKI